MRRQPKPSKGGCKAGFPQGRSRAIWLLALIAPLLSGCVTPQERRAGDEGRCRSYGFRPGTEAFAKCLLDIDLSRDADRRAFLNGPYPGWDYGVGPRRYW